MLGADHGADLGVIGQRVADAQFARPGHEGLKKPIMDSFLDQQP
jgi:hypothetical protein